MPNQTLLKFGYPDSLVQAYGHWVVLVRPKQVTAGSLVLAHDGEATRFGDLPPGAYVELSLVTRDLEAALRAAFAYDKINYLMLMMVDPHVHFHVFPRYATSRSVGGVAFVDRAWPGPPDISDAVSLDASALRELVDLLKRHWRSRAAPAGGSRSPPG